MNQFSVLVRMLGWIVDGSCVEYTKPMLNLAPSFATRAQIFVTSVSLPLGSKVWASST